MKTGFAIRVSAILFAGIGPLPAEDDFVARMRTASELHERGEYVNAEQVLLSILRDTEGLGPADPRRGAVLNNLGAVYQYTNRFLDAERCYRQAVDIERTAWGTGEDRPIRAIVNLASVYIESGQYGKAERLGLGVLAERLAAAGRRDADVARLLETLGALELQEGHSSKAEQYELNALAILDELAPDGSDAMESLNFLGIIYGQTGRATEALSCSERALGIAAKILPPKHPMNATFLTNAGTYHAVVHGPNHAEPYYQMALEIAENGLGREHPLVGRILSFYAVVLEQTNRKAQAKEYRRRARAILEATAKTDPWSYTVDLNELLRHRAKR